MSEITQIAFMRRPWEISAMAKVRPKGISSRIETLLKAAQPEGMSARQWLIAAGVNTSFFTDLRNGREPGIDKVEALAREAGLKLSELIDGAEPPRNPMPTVDELMQLLADAQGELPSGTNYADWPRYVAQALLPRLERLLADRRADPYGEKETSRDRGAQSRAATKQDVLAG